MSFRNAPFYSFPHQISPPHQIQYEMELPFLLYIYRDWSIFHWDTFVQTFNKTFIFFVRAFSELWEENIFTISLYLFLICWMFARLGCESVFSKQKVLVCVLPSLSLSCSLFLSAAIFQLFFHWRRNCSNLLMQAKRNNLWEKISLLEN